MRFSSKMFSYFSKALTLLIMTNKSKRDFLITLHFTFWALFPVATFSQEILWEKSYGGINPDYVFETLSTSDYGFIVAGSSASGKTGNKSDANRGNLDYWIWKMDEKGDLQWQRTYGGKGMDFLSSIKRTTDSGYIIAGSSDSSLEGDKKDTLRGKLDYWIIKTNAVGDEEWQKTIGGSGSDELTVAFQTSDGGYILAGSSDSAISGEKKMRGFGGMDYWLVKLNDVGDIEWQKSYGGLYADMLRSVEETTDKGFIIGGYSNSPESGNKAKPNFGMGDYWILKLDKNGNLEWENTYGGNLDENICAVHQTLDGNFLLAGNSFSSKIDTKRISNVKGSDIWLLKLDSNGNDIWQRVYNVGEFDNVTSVTENPDETFIIGMYCNSEVNGTKKTDRKEINDYLTIKLDKNGEKIWTKAVGGNGEDILKQIIEVRDGAYLLSGTSKSIVSRDRNSTIGQNDFWVVKLMDKEKPKKKRLPVEAIPNPTASYTTILIGYEYKNGTLTIADISGQILEQFSISEQSIFINLESYPEGIYIVNVKTDVQNDGVKVIKSIKK